MLKSTSYTELLKSGSLIVNSIRRNNNKNQILDPISCIIRLGMMSFKPEGSKISINDNKITFHDNKFFQGILRWNSGDSRDDLHNLHNPIQKISEWYDSNIKEIKNVIIIAIEGIKNLKQSYEKESIIQYTLDRYIDILNNSLDKSKNNKERILDNSEIDLSSSILKNEVSKEINKKQDLNDSQYIDKKSEGENNHVYNELKKLWKFREIKIVNGIFLEIKKKKNSQIELEAYMKSLEIIVESKENQVLLLIKKAYTVL
jgi:hypothetical protein